MPAHNELYRKLVHWLHGAAQGQARHYRLAQVNGYRVNRHRGKMQKRIEYDLDYLRNWPRAWICRSSQDRRRCSGRHAY